MTLTKDHVREVIATYIKAWVSQDPDLIVTIFTPGATYHERVMGEPIPDREAIRAYWESKVVGTQANITCELLALYVDAEESTAVAEWEAVFDDLAKGVRKRMRETAILTFEDGLISSLREYWSSQAVAQLGTESQCQQ
jgi:ketosteroid isomerase-like protein